MNHLTPSTAEVSCYSTKLLQKHSETHDARGRIEAWGEKKLQRMCEE